MLNKSAIVSLLLGATSATEVKEAAGFGPSASAPKHDEKEVAKDLSLLDDENSKCYRARYYDIDSSMSALEHYNKIGKKQGRHFPCGRRLTDHLVMRFLEINPEFTQKHGYEGENVYKLAREYFSKTGRKQVWDTMLTHGTTSKCSEELGNCRCKGSVYLGYKNRPDTGEVITDFDTFYNFDTVKQKSSKAKVFKCSAEGFGRDLQKGAKKQCFCEREYPKQSQMCGLQGENCSCPAGTAVVYGIRDGFLHKKKYNKDGERAWMYQVLKRQYAVAVAGDSGVVKCDGSTFGGIDPLPNTPKACFCNTGGELKVNKIKAKMAYWDKKIKANNAKKVRENQKKALTAASKQTQKVISSAAAQTQKMDAQPTKSPACGEKCTLETNKQQGELKKAELTNEYKTKITEIQNKIEQQETKLEEAEKKKNSAEGVKAVADSNATPAEQTKLKTEFTTINNQANSDIATAQTEENRLREELDEAQKEMNAKISQVETETQASVEAGIQKVKEADSKNAESKAKIDMEVNHAKETALTEEVNSEKIEQEAVIEEIDNAKEELNSIDDEIKELQKEKDDNDNKLNNIDGGAAVEVEKAAELAKTITDAQAKLTQTKTEAAADTAKLTAQAAKLEADKAAVQAQIEEKKADLEKAQKDLDKHKLDQQKSMNELEKDPKNPVAQKGVELGKETTSIDNKIIESKKHSLDKVMTEQSQIENNAANVEQQLNNITLTLENRTIEIGQEVTHKTELQVERAEEVATNAATQAKADQLNNKLNADVQAELTNQKSATLTKVTAQVATSTQSHNSNIEHNKAKLTELAAKQKAATLSTTLEPKEKVKAIAKIADDIAKTQAKIVEETGDIAADQAKVAELKAEVVTEKAKQVTLETKSKAAEAIYTTTVKSNKATHDAELTDATTKATAAKAAADAATSAASTVKAAEEKIIDTVKGKTKTCQQKLKEAQTQHKLLITQKTQLTDQINKALTTATGKATAKPLQAKVTEIEGNITAQKAIIDANTACIATGVSEEAASREKIIVAKDKAIEAVTEAKQTAQTQEIVQAAVNQTIQIEQEITNELAADWNKTDDSVKALIKEQVTVAAKKKEEQVKVKETVAKVEKEKAQVQDLTADIADKTSQVEKLDVQIQDPKNAPQLPKLKADQEKLKQEINNEEQLSTVTQQALNKDEKLKNELKQSVKDANKEQIEVNQKIEDLKFDLVQESADKQFIDTKLKQDKSKNQQLIAREELKKEQAQETVNTTAKLIKSATKIAEDHTKAKAEQENIKNQLTTQVAGLKESAASKAVPDPADAEEIAAATAKLAEVTAAAAAEQAEIDNQKAKVAELEAKKKAAETTEKEAEVNVENANKKIDQIQKQVSEIETIKEKGDKVTKELKKAADIAVTKATEAAKDLDETMAEKTELTEKQVSLVAEEGAEKKAIADLQAKKEVAQKAMINSPTMTPEEVADAQQSISQIDADIKKVQEKAAVTETEKATVQDKLVTIEPEIAEKQQSVSLTTKDAEAQQAAIAEVATTTAAQNDQEITEVIEENKAVDEKIAEVQAEKKKVKAEVEEAEKEKETIDKNIANDKLDLEKAKESQVSSANDAKFATCQALYYGLPEEQRRQLFSYAQKDENGSEVCKTTKLNPSVMIYVDIKGDKVNGFKKSIMKFALQKDVESVLVSTDYYSVDLYSYENAKPKGSYKPTKMTDRISFQVMMPGGTSVCQAQEFFDNNFGYIQTSRIGHYAITEVFEKEPLNQVV